MEQMNKRRVLLQNMIRLEKHDMELIKSENRQARQALTQMERNVKTVNRAIQELEGHIRAALNGQSAFSIDDLQGQRHYLAYQRAQLVEHEGRQAQALAMVERIGNQLTQKQKKLNKLHDLSDDVAKQICQANETRVGKENDELWIHSQERSR